MLDLGVDAVGRVRTVEDEVVVDDRAAGLAGLWAAAVRLVVGLRSADPGVRVDLRSEVVPVGLVAVLVAVVPDRDVLFAVPDNPDLLSSPELAMLLPFSSAELPTDMRGRCVVAVPGAAFRAVVAVGRIGGLFKVLPVVRVEVVVGREVFVVDDTGAFFEGVPVRGRLAVAVFCSGELVTFSLVCSASDFDSWPSLGTSGSGAATFSAVSVTGGRFSFDAIMVLYREDRPLL